MNNRENEMQTGQYDSQTEQYDSHTYLIAAFSITDALYAISSQPIKGKPVFEQYANEFISKESQKIIMPIFQIMPIHILAWHYMEKYNGKPPTLNELTGAIPEFLNSDFMPWASVYSDTKNSSTIKYANCTTDSELQKIESATALLKMCDYSTDTVNFTDTYQKILASTEFLEKYQNNVLIKILCEELEKNSEKRFNPNHKKLIVKISEQILENAHIGMDRAPALFEIATIISYIWDEKKKVTFKNILAQMEQFPDNEIIDLLHFMAQNHKDVKVKKEIHATIINVERAMGEMLEMAQIAGRTMSKNKEVKYMLTRTRNQENNQDVQKAQQLKLK